MILGDVCVRFSFFAFFLLFLVSFSFPARPRPGRPCRGKPKGTKESRNEEEKEEEEEEEEEVDVCRGARGGAAAELPVLAAITYAHTSDRRPAREPHCRCRSGRSC